MSPKRMCEPSASSSAGTLAGMGNGDDPASGCSRPCRSSGMDGQRRARGHDDLGVVADVVPMAVGAHDEAQVPALVGQLLRHPAHRRRGRVDRDGLLGPQVGEDPDVGGHGSRGELQHLHGRSIAARG